jgi:hypothetical protein
MSSRRSFFKRYSYAWITLVFFGVSIAGHWYFGWKAFVSEQIAHQQPVEASDFWIQMGRDTFENWQSEFLQLLWQVGGLAYFLYLGSPQSKEGDDRMEAKIDEILRLLDPKNGDATIDHIDKHYTGRETDEHLEAIRAKQGG